jgi:protein gp37
MELDWVRNVREQCRDNEIPFFFKQVGGTKKVNGTWGGDLLDGKQYHEFPVR